MGAEEDAPPPAAEEDAPADAAPAAEGSAASTPSEPGLPEGNMRRMRALVGFRRDMLGMRRNNDFQEVGAQRRATFRGLRPELRHKLRREQAERLGDYKEAEIRHGLLLEALAALREGKPPPPIAVPPELLQRQELVRQQLEAQQEERRLAAARTFTISSAACCAALVAACAHQPPRARGGQSKGAALAQDSPLSARAKPSANLRVRGKRGRKSDAGFFTAAQSDADCDDDDRDDACSVASFASRRSRASNKADWGSPRTDPASAEPGPISFSPFAEHRTADGEEFDLPRIWKQWGIPGLEHNKLGHARMPFDGGEGWIAGDVPARLLIVGEQTPPQSPTSIRADDGGETLTLGLGDKSFSRRQRSMRRGSRRGSRRMSRRAGEDSEGSDAGSGVLGTGNRRVSRRKSNMTGRKRMSLMPDAGSAGCRRVSMAVAFGGNENSEDEDGEDDRGDDVWDEESESGEASGSPDAPESDGGPRVWIPLNQEAMIAAVAGTVATFGAACWRVTSVWAAMPPSHPVTPETLKENSTLYAAYAWDRITSRAEFGVLGWTGDVLPGDDPVVAWLEDVKRHMKPAARQAAERELPCPTASLPEDPICPEDEVEFSTVHRVVRDIATMPTPQGMTDREYRAVMRRLNLRLLQHREVLDQHNEHYTKGSAVVSDLQQLWNMISAATASRRAAEERAMLHWDDGGVTLSRECQYGLVKKAERQSDGHHHPPQPESGRQFPDAAGGIPSDESRAGRRNSRAALAARRPSALTSPACPDSLPQPQIELEPVPQEGSSAPVPLSVLPPDVPSLSPAPLSRRSQVAFSEDTQSAQGMPTAQFETSPSRRRDLLLQTETTGLDDHFLRQSSRVSSSYPAGMEQAPWMRRGSVFDKAKEKDRPPAISTGIAVLALSRPVPAAQVAAKIAAYNARREATAARVNIELPEGGLGVIPAFSAKGVRDLGDDGSCTGRQTATPTSPPVAPLSPTSPTGPKAIGTRKSFASFASAGTAGIPSAERSEEKDLRGAIEKRFGSCAFALRPHLQTEGLCQIYGSLRRHSAGVDEPELEPVHEVRWCKYTAISDGGQLLDEFRKGGNPPPSPDCAARDQPATGRRPSLRTALNSPGISPIERSFGLSDTMSQISQLGSPTTSRRLMAPSPRFPGQLKLPNLSRHTAAALDAAQKSRPDPRYDFLPLASGSDEKHDGARCMDYRRPRPAEEPPPDKDLRPTLRLDDFAAATNGLNLGPLQRGPADECPLPPAGYGAGLVVFANKKAPTGAQLGRQREPRGKAAARRDLLQNAQKGALRQLARDKWFIMRPFVRTRPLSRAAEPPQVDSMRKGDFVRSAPMPAPVLILEDQPAIRLD